MSERPIIFSGEMVRAILDVRKTQTRRVIRGARGAFWDHRGYKPLVDSEGQVFFIRPEGAMAEGKDNVIAFKHLWNNIACDWTLFTVQQPWRKFTLDLAFDGLASV